MSNSVATSMSWTFTRTCSPSRRTVPSSTFLDCRAFRRSLRPSRFLPLNANADVRAATLSPARWERGSISSSARPSLKYSSSASPVEVREGEDGDRGLTGDFGAHPALRETRPRVRASRRAPRARAHRPSTRSCVRRPTRPGPAGRSRSARRRCRRPASGIPRRPTSSRPGSSRLTRTDRPPGPCDTPTPFARAVPQAQPCC